MKKSFFRSTRKRGIPDSMDVLPKIRRMHCKTMTSFLSEGSPRRLGLTQSSDAWNLGTLFAVVWETFTGFPKLGSVLSEEFKSKLCRTDERICPKVFSSFGCISSTLFEIFFFLLTLWWLGCTQAINAITKNNDDKPRKFQSEMLRHSAFLFRPTEHKLGTLMVCNGVKHNLFDLRVCVSFFVMPCM